LVPTKASSERNARLIAPIDSFTPPRSSTKASAVSLCGMVMLQPSQSGSAVRAAK